MNLHLESWLASATLDLALSERQRIYEEISAHVNDAIAHQTAQGLSELDAEARAIQDLGDPALLEPRFSAPATHSLTRFGSSDCWGAVGGLYR